MKIYLLLFKKYYFGKFVGFVFLVASCNKRTPSFYTLGIPHDGHGRTKYNQFHVILLQLHLNLSSAGILILSVYCQPYFTADNIL